MILLAFTRSGTLNRMMVRLSGISLLWRSSEYSVRASIRNAMSVVNSGGYRSIAFPLIGAGSGGGTAARVKRWMLDELASIEYSGRVLVVTFKVD
jgi:O-acetyl-ADP-ribose deacetylase (regulator of RNase III)